MKKWWNWLLGIALICLLFLAIPISYSNKKQSALQSMFNEYVEKYNKSYKNKPDEYQTRFQHFVASVEEIEQLNSESRGPEEYRARYGLTHLSDMSKAEYRDIHLSDERMKKIPKLYGKSWSNSDDRYKYHKDDQHGRKVDHRRDRSPGESHDNIFIIIRKRRAVLPLQVDWRAKGVIGPVRDQGLCGACWAFSTIGTMEAMAAIKTGKLETLSVQMRRVNLKEVSQVSSKFATWTKAELETLFMPSKKGNCKPTNKTTFNVDVYLPAAIDWRKEGVIGDVIDQRHCNICWQVCIVQVMETMVAIDHNASHVTPLSIQEFMDCSYTVACEPGDIRAALDYMIDNNMSIVTETQYPLTMKIEQCRYTEFPKGVMIKEYHVACNVSKEYVMSLLAHGPVIATVDPDQWIYYSGGIITQNCNHFKPKHVVQIVGYDCTGEIDYYIVKNSWGNDFGDNGYAYIEMGKNLCGIEDYVTSLNVVY